MARITKVIQLHNDANTTTTSTTYVVVNTGYNVYWDNDVYDGDVKVYFEAILSTTSGGTAYAMFYTAGGSSVSGSEVTTTATGATRVRSGDIKANLTDNTEYRSRFKASSGATTTIYNVRLVIVQTGAVTKTETQIPLSGQIASYNSNNSVVDNPYSYLYYFDQNRYDGSVSIYFESFLRNTGVGVTTTAYMTDTSNTVLTSVSRTSTTAARVRSSAITPTDGTTYKIRMRTSSAGQYAFVMDTRLIIQQTGFTKTETHYPVRVTQLTDNTTGGIDINGKLYWDKDEWSVASNAVYHEATMLISTGTKTALLDLNDGSGDVTNATLSTSSTSKTRVRSSSAIYLADNTEYDGQLRIDSTTATATEVGARLIIHTQLMNAPNFGTNF